MTRQAIHDGLKDQHRNAIIQVLAAHPRIQRAILFGSRAMGTYSSASDIDIALVGDALDATDLARLAGQMEELNVPQKVDLLLHCSIQSPQLLEHIEKHGVVVWERAVVSAEITDCLEVPPVGWGVRRLSELGEVNRGRSRHRPRWDPRLYGGPYPFIQTGDVKAASGLLTTASQSYSEAGLEQSRLWPKGTLCITIAANIAETAVLGFDACFPDSIVGFIPDCSLCAVQFVEYWFRCERQRIQREASGSVQDNINLDTIDRLEFPLPPLPEQRRIAAVLGALDDKIELNRRMNQTLEAMAQALFKSWFIDFDGHSDLVDSELGPIPRGWRVGKFTEFLDVLGGGTPSRGVPRFWGTGHKWVSATDITKADGAFVVQTAEQVTAEGLAGCSAKLCPAGTTVITARGTVGETAMLAEPMCFNQTCYGILPIRSHWRYIAYMQIRSIVAQLKQQAYGSIFDTITRRTFDAQQICWPDDDSGSGMEAVFQSIFESVLANSVQSRTLAALRDTLLPKLISGEIRVPEIEGLVEEAV